MIFESTLDACAICKIDLPEVSVSVGKGARVGVFVLIFCEQHGEAIHKLIPEDGYDR